MNRFVTHLLTVAIASFVCVPQSSFAQSAPVEAEDATGEQAPHREEAKEVSTPASVSPEDFQTEKKALDPDSKPLRNLFVEALSLLRKGQYEEAIAALDRVAKETQLTHRREAAEKLRIYATKMQQLIEEDPTQAVVPMGNGRAEFITTTTLISFYSGVVLLDLLDTADDFRISVVTLLGTTGVGLTWAILGSRNAGIRETDASSYSLGALWGGGTALLATTLANPDGTEAYQGSLLVGLGGGATAGYFLSKHLNPTPGQIAFTNATMTLGFGSALLVSPILGETGVNNMDLHQALWLSGLQLGTGAGFLFGKDLDWSQARANLSLLGAGVGALTVWGATSLVTGADDNVQSIWSGAALVGLWGGFGLTAWLTDGMAPDPLYDEEASTVFILPSFTKDSLGIGIAGLF